MAELSAPLLHQGTAYPATVAAVQSIVTTAAEFPHVRAWAVHFAGRCVMGGGRSLAAKAACDGAFAAATRRAAAWCSDAYSALSPEDARHGLDRAIPVDFTALHAGTEALAIAASEHLDAISVAGEVEMDLVCGECRAGLCLYWSAEERVVWVLDGGEPQPTLDERGAPLSAWLAEGARLLDEACTPGAASELTSLRSLVLAASSLSGLRDRQLAAQLLLPYRPFACPSCKKPVDPFDASGATGSR